MTKPTCHCCGKELYGCTGSLSFPDGLKYPMDDTRERKEFHCDRCTFRLQGADPFTSGFPCHVQRKIGDDLSRH